YICPIDPDIDGDLSTSPARLRQAPFSTGAPGRDTIFPFAINSPIGNGGAHDGVRCEARVEETV
ncbi:unnamed protein product, partial [Allacma fusca]